ncbi:ABC transporter permease subunit, partial [Luminiphilus sp.]|nr:ABC transporter permease subunit [Luminiphilus sp.]
PTQLRSDPPIHLEIRAARYLAGARHPVRIRYISSVVASGARWVLSGGIALLLYAYVYRFLTVAYQSVDAEFSGISPDIDAAARTLGAAPSQILWRIHLPLLRPSILAASLLVFVDVMRELPATLILRPFNFDTLATRVYRLASDERLADASLPAIVIVLVGVIPVLLLQRSSATRETIKT